MQWWGKSIFPSRPAAVFYHTVLLNEFPYLNQLYKVKTPKEFKEDLKFYTENFNVVTPEEWPKENSLLLTFDDGLYGALEYILPLLKKYKVKALFNVVRSFANKDPYHRHVTASMAYENKKEIDPGLYLNPSQIDQVYSSGHTIGAHSLTHPRMNKLSAEQRKEEVLDSVEWIQERWPSRKKYFAFPYGSDGIPEEEMRQWSANPAGPDLILGTGALTPSSPPLYHRIDAEEIRNMKLQLINKSLRFRIKKMVGLYD